MSTAESIKTEISRLQTRMLVAPFLTLAITMASGFLIWLYSLIFVDLVNNESESIEDPEGYITWLASLPSAVGSGLDITAALLASGALTLAMFLTLNLSANADDSIEPRAVQAQRVVLSKLSLAVASLNAVGAWSTVPLIGIRGNTIPEITLAIAVATLCSTLVPLHLERSTTLQLGLQESRLLKSRLRRIADLLETRTNSTQGTLLYRRPKLSLYTWITCVGAINVIIGQVFFLLYRPVELETGLGEALLGYGLLAVATFVQATLWARCTVWILSEWSLDRARQKSTWVAATLSMYVFLTLVVGSLSWVTLSLSGHFVAAAITATLCASSFPLAYYADRQYTRLLDGYLHKRFLKTINAVDVQIESFTSSLRNMRRYESASEGQILRRITMRKMHPPRRMQQRVNGSHSGHAQ